MKYIKLHILLFLSMICIFSMGSTQAFASPYVIPEGPSPSFEKESIGDHLGIALLEEEPSHAPISCFDVSADGKIAIGFQKAGNDKIISVYSAQNEFLFGFSFQCYGSIDVFWRQENICIYFVRGRSVAVVDASGNCETICAASELGVKGELLKRIQSPIKEADGKQYSLERDVPLGDKYGRLCVTYPDGTRCVLYDVTVQHNVTVIAATIGAIVFVSTALYFNVKKRRMRK